MRKFSFRKSKKGAASNDAANTLPPPPPRVWQVPFSRRFQNEGEEYDLTFPTEGGWQYKSTTSEWIVKSSNILSISYANVENRGTTLTKTWGTNEIEKVTELGEETIDGVGKVRRSLDLNTIV